MENQRKYKQQLKVRIKASTKQKKMNLRMALEWITKEKSSVDKN